MPTLHLTNNIASTRLKTTKFSTAVIEETNIGLSTTNKVEDHTSHVLLHQTSVENQGTNPANNESNPHLSQTTPYTEVVTIVSNTLNNDCPLPIVDYTNTMVSGNSSMLLVTCKDG